MDKLFQEYTS